jgi:DNA-binding SARP family transcriptional activator
VLLVSANRPLSVSRLVDAVWPDRPPPTAVGALRTYVSTLRRELQLSGGVRMPRVVTEAAGYRMDVTAADLDLLAFAELATRGERALRKGNPLAASEQLRRGLALWRGRPLEDVTVDADPDGRLVVAEERRLAASETLVEARLALGQHAELAAELRVLVEEHPLRERLWQHWMLALYRAGRQAEALAAYRQLRDQLVRELGTEPGGAVRDLHEPMLAADPVLDLPGQMPGGRGPWCRAGCRPTWPHSPAAPPSWPSSLPGCGAIWTTECRRSVRSTASRGSASQRSPCTPRTSSRGASRTDSCTSTCQTARRSAS